MKTSILYTAALFVVTGFMVSCGSSTDIMAVWRSPEVTTGQYKNICIAAITENATNKQVVEQEMHNQLQTKGVKSTRIVDLLPYKFTGTATEKDLILEKVRANSNDAILTFALIKQKEETRYVPGSVYAPPAAYGYYGTFGGYYGYYGTRMYDPGYYTQDEIYFIETNLYDVKTEKLVWSVQSKTYNPSSINQFAQDFTIAITKQLIKSHVIEPVVN
jgi:hypothetical protein